MSVEILGLDEVTRQLRRTADRTSKAQLARLKQGVEDITEEAKKNAPVDEGNLEEAITAVATRVGTFNRRWEFIIGVDKQKLGPGKNPGNFDYDIQMHEGVYNLGKRSQEKQNRLGNKVGAKYLARALDKYQAELEQDMIDIVKRETRT